MASAGSERAAAQILPEAGGISWKLNKVGDDTYQDATNTTPINKAQCDAKAILDLSLMDIPQGFKYLEVWAGNVCNEANRQARIDATPCQYVNSQEIDPVTTQLASFGVPVETLCALGDGKRSYFILPTNTLMGTAAAASFATVTLNIDTVPPEPLSALRLDSSQAQPTLVWTRTPGESLRYWLVIDSSANVAVADQDAGAEADSCGSQVLVPGAEFDWDHAGQHVTLQRVAPETASLALNPSDLGSAGSAVAMLVDDSAGNHSVLSNVVCVPATAKSAAEPRHSGDCSIVAVGERRSGAAAWLTLAAIGSSGAWRRARRRA
jgi:hypothetical protein